MASNKQRIGIASLAFSAFGLVGLAVKEGYSDKAIIPVKGDVPTIGFGSTFREDGSKVEMGDSITPQKALARTLLHVQKDENGLKQCVRSPLTQKEYDTLVDFSYQYGSYAACKSGVVRYINAGEYAKACGVYLEYKKVGPTDCSLPQNAHVCGGVWTRSKDRYAACMEEQK